MNVREWMNNNSALVTIGAVVLLVIALGIILLQTGDGITSGPIMMYYYDLNEGRLIQVMSDQPAPVETASGPHDGMPAGVRAHVYTCGECSDFTGMTEDEISANEAYIAYIERYTPAGKAALMEAGSESGIDLRHEIEVKRPGDANWVLMSSPQGEEITENAIRICPDSRPANRCRP